MHGIVLYIDRVLNKCVIFSVILSDTMTFTTILQPCLADYFGMGRNMLIFKLLSLTPNHLLYVTLKYYSWGLCKPQFFFAAPFC